MNKQELIEKYQQIYEVSNNTDFGLDPFSRGEDAGSSRCSFEIVEDLKKLDEPQKVKVPAAIGNHIRKRKIDGDNFHESILATNSQIYEWYMENAELYEQAWVNDFEVEEEPLFYIRLTIPSSSVVGLYLGFNKDGIFDHSYGKPHVTWDWKCTFTEHEIKSIDERYWPFAVPVEKV